MSVARRLMSGNGYAFETITVAGTAIGFTAATASPAAQNDAQKRAFVTLSGGSIRYRYDGSDPTATVGHRLMHGDSIAVEGGVNIANFKAIREGDVSGTLSVTYEAIHG